MNVILNKIESIKRCILRVSQEYAGNPENLADITKQDSIVLNLQRACELSIDMANYIIARDSMGIPQSSRDAFEILKNHSLLTDAVSVKMQKMVGFRNIAVHEYQSLSLDVLKSIIESHLSDFEEFYQSILNDIRKN